MKHLLVYVIGDNVDEQLAPYGALNEDYYEFVPEITDEELPKLFNEFIESRVELINELKEKGCMVPKHLIDDISYSSPEKWVKNWWKLQHDEEKGWGYVCNPNGKWAYYQIGGRWEPLLKLKLGKHGYVNMMDFTIMEFRLKKAPDGYADQALIKDVDWEGIMIDNVMDADWKWDHQVFTTDVFSTKEIYIDYSKSIAPYAFVHGGEWFDRGIKIRNGEVFCQIEKEIWEKLFRELIQIEQERWITVVDCRI